jgi:hypothetical protein
MAAGKKTKVKVIDCSPVYHGTNVKGGEYTIHEVKATNMEGELINQKLRSFSALPIGQVVEVTVVPFKSEEHGKSFTLYPVGSGGGTTQASNDLRVEINQLREMISTLGGRVGAIEGYLRKQAVPGATTEPVPLPGAGSPDLTAQLDAKFGADAPFS